MVDSISSSNSELEDLSQADSSPLPLTVKTTMNNNKNNDIMAAKGGAGLGGTLLCKWERCNSSFTSLIDLVAHLHDEHVGRKKAAYTCEWAGCPRKSKTQTSRFALITHLRSHTGEKPFTCEIKGCEKKFTRPDSLTKHMKSQHEDTSDNKKKRNMEEIFKQNPETSPYINQSHIYTTSSSSGNDEGGENIVDHEEDDRDNDSEEVEYDDERKVNNNNIITTGSSSSRESSTANVHQHPNQHHGQVQQKSYHEKYLILKAKHRYIRRENELLIDEYQAIKKKLKRLRTEKDILLDATMDWNTRKKSYLMVKVEMAIKRTHDKKLSDKLQVQE
ncbi:10609_t:CDS:2 [Ambispora gerdemannii]|uniref:10609_t:CDS:1 n=1 Tax=Ambispora gerdemannii TaxID=144530 RepID=A0A9N9DJ32_9GLOM|nr:10609_t:CDS:2 [Ambispora gerdemannii]